MPCMEQCLYPSWPGTLRRFPTAFNSHAPSVVSGNGGIHVVWEEAGNLLHSHGDGEDWTRPVTIAVGDSHAMAVDGEGSPHLVWANETGDTFQIFHSRWESGEWAWPQTVFATDGQSGAPDIAISVAVGDSIHVVWADYYSGESHIYYAESQDGRAWLEGTWIPGAAGGVPAIAVGNDGTIHVAWQDDSEPGHTRNDIYYCARTRDGNWCQVSENVSQTPDTDSTRPDLVLDATGSVHLVWERSAGGQVRLKGDCFRHDLRAKQRDVYFLPDSCSFPVEKSGDYCPS